MLKVTDVSLRFGGLQVLRRVSFCLGDSEILAVIGPNGAGKSALLNVISGIYRPDEGDVVVGETSLLGLRPDRISALGIGRSFQHLELFGRLTVLENLLVARHAHMRSGAATGSLFWGRARREETEHRRRAEEILDFFELWPYRHKTAGSLPFGIQKLVGVARAMATDPRVLLLDEPGSGLSRDEKEDLARFLLRLRYDVGIPMLWIEHDTEMVVDLADRVVVLNYGAVIAQGSPEEIRTNEEVLIAYLGETPQAAPDASEAATP
jgi:branched-chain amino acid transport system ATP-binding protein